MLSHRRKHHAAQWILSIALMVSGAVNAQSPTSADPIRKGDFRYSEPPALPQATLELAPLLQQVAERAAVHCGTAAAAASLALGKDGGKVIDPDAKGGNAVGKLVGGLLGTPGGRSRPKLAKDPIRKKHKQKFSDPDKRIKVSLGARREGEQLLLSTRIDSAKQKGTYHAIFLERPDCVRYFPVKRETYGLWGSWQLSVSVTKTTSRYRNGDLIDRSVSRSGWQRSGRFNLGQLRTLLSDLRNAPQTLFNPAASYAQQLQDELAVPLWQQLGFGEPLQGPRTIGTYFDVSPQELTPGTIAVIHITQKRKGEFSTVGLPVTLKPNGQQAFDLALLAP